MSHEAILLGIATFMGGALVTAIVANITAWAAFWRGSATREYVDQRVDALRAEILRHNERVEISLSEIRTQLTGIAVGMARLHGRDQETEE